MPQPDEVSLGDDARERLQLLLTAIRNTQREYELMLYIERFFSMQAEIRNYFSLIERETIDKLREFRDRDESSLPPTRSVDVPNVFVPGEHGESHR
jgi:hypothetical protein